MSSCVPSDLEEAAVTPLTSPAACTGPLLPGVHERPGSQTPANRP